MASFLGFHWRLTLAPLPDSQNVCSTNNTQTIANIGQIYLYKEILCSQNPYYSPHIRQRDIIFEPPNWSSWFGAMWNTVNINFAAGIELTASAEYANVNWQNCRQRWQIKSVKGVIDREKMLTIDVNGDMCFNWRMTPVKISCLTDVAVEEVSRWQLVNGELIPDGAILAHHVAPIDHDAVFVPQQHGRWNAWACEVKKSVIIRVRCLIGVEWIKNSNKSNKHWVARSKIAYLRGTRKWGWHRNFDWMDQLLSCARNCHVDHEWQFVWEALQRKEEKVLITFASVRHYY